MNSETIVYLVVALLLGMLLANMLKNVCGCRKKKEGFFDCAACVWTSLPGTGDIDWNACRNC